LLQKALTFDSKESVVKLLGARDGFLRQIRDAFDVKVVARGHQLSIEGPDRQVADCQQVLAAMQEQLAQNRPLSEDVVSRLIQDQQNRRGYDARADVALGSFLGRQPATPKTAGQARYVKAVLENDIVFCIGPAGTGKTYLAVAVALDFLKRGELKRIVLCRPAVEAGEHLGFLPGDMRAKVNPYLRPLYDALHDLMDPAQVRKYVDNDLIEILPLAFVRGRTLDNAFIILDEAQNCTVAQMKTFLTRLGSVAKLVVTGDITQVDLPGERQSGLVDVQGRLTDIRGIKFVRLDEGDIVRHRLVRDIVNAYQREAPPEASGAPESNTPPVAEDADNA
jgi:phosphate starvation-inducible PhoH-like protein